MPRLLRYRIPLFLAIVSILLYAPAIAWGLPSGTRPELVQPWSPDDLAPLGPLSEIHNTFVNSKADRYLAYPLLHYLILAVAYAPYVLLLLLTGSMSTPGPEFPYGLRDPVTALAMLSLIARSVTLLMAAGTVLAAYALGRSLWDERRALLCGLFVMLLFPMFYYSRTANLDGPALFWSACAFLIYARILRYGFSSARGVWLGVFAALAAGTKDQAATLFPLLALVLVPLQLRTPSSIARAPVAARWHAPLATLVGGLITYGLASGFVFDPQRYLDHLAYITGKRPDSPIYFGEEASLEGYLALLRHVVELLAGSMGEPIFVAGILGILMAIRRDRMSLSLLLPVLGLLLVVIVPTRYVEMRFLMPVAFILACFAAYVVGEIPPRRSVLTALAVALMAFLPAARGIDLTYAMLNDTRYRAAAWLDHNARPGDHVGFFGPSQKLPRVTTNIEFVRPIEFIGANRNVHYDPTDIDAMANRITQAAPEFILVIPDHSSYPGFPFGTTCPVELYERLRDHSLGYELAEHLESTPLLPWVNRPSVVSYPLVDPWVEVFVRSTDVASTTRTSDEPRGSQS